VVEMNLYVPRDYEPDSDVSTGAEEWASKFIYPNGWSLSSFKKVAIKEPVRWHITNSVESSTVSPFVVLFVFFSVLLLCNKLAF